jgi:hypothetical protein
MLPVVTVQSVADDVERLIRDLNDLIPFVREVASMLLGNSMAPER